jgi:protein ImuB
MIVQRCCKKSAQAGTAPGMSLALAKALVPDAVTRPFNPLEDFKALSKLGQRALHYTPLAGLDSELVEASRRQLLHKISPLYNGLILDMTGTDKLYREEREPARTILHNLKRAGIKAKIGIAATIGAAWAFSRYSSKQLTIVSKNNLRSEISKLSAAALRLEEDTTEALEEMGIYDTQQLLGLPRKDLLKRFGYQLIKRLDQAFGHIPETICNIHQPTLFAVNREFETPLTKQESIKTAILGLFQDLGKELHKKHKNAAAFIISLTGLDAEFKVFTIKKELSLQSAVNQFDQIAAIIQPLLEKLPNLRGITALRIEGTDTVDCCKLQNDFIAGTELPEIKNSKVEFLNTLGLRLGTKQIRKVALHQSYLPERSFSFPALTAATDKIPELLPGHLFQERPFYILQVPEAIDAIALLPDKPPAWIKWREEKHRILKAVGPERIAREWWLGLVERTENERDYFKVQDQAGRWLWVFREQLSAKWFLHGVWT